MNRHNIELLIAWLDALRRRDLPALTERLDPQATWQGVRLDLVCHGREEIVQTFVGQRDEGYDVDALELIGAADHAILHARLSEPQEMGGVTAQGGMYNVFRIEQSTITRIEDYLDRDDALRAAGLLVTQ
ncbi:MAG: nuclear transport factor 2 family protein [Solirubrobacterales bacterium]